MAKKTVHQSPAAAAVDTAPPSASARFGGRLGSPWALVIAVGMGVFVGGFDQTFVVPVFSRILDDLDITVDQYGKASWIINGYLLGYTVAMPVMGRIADVYGHLRVFVLGLLIFIGGSVLVALAPTLTTVTLARAVTALGGGALVPVSLAIAAESLPARRRPLGLSSISMLDDASSLLGPLWGTLIGVWLGWRGLFWMNIVLGVPVLLVVLLLARPTRTRSSATVDWAGGALLTGALTSLTFAIADAGIERRPVVQTLSIYLLSAVLFFLFAYRELHTYEPLIDLRMFRSLRVSAANVAFLLTGGALITTLVNIPLMTEALWDKHGAQPGLMLMRMVLFMIAGGLLGGVLAPRIGFRATAFAGFLLAAIGLFGMAAWPERPSEAARWAALATAGLGFTLVDAPVYATIVNTVQAGRRASAAALLQVLQATGMIIGMALLASQGLGRFNERAGNVFGDTSATLEDRLNRLRPVEHRTFDETFIVAGIAMLVAAALALSLESRRGGEARWTRLVAEAEPGADQP